MAVQTFLGYSTSPVDRKSGNSVEALPRRFQKVRRLAEFEPAETDDFHRPLPNPCGECGGMMLWWNADGIARCMDCDPPTTALRLLENAMRLREQYGMEAGAARENLLTMYHNSDAEP